MARLARRVQRRITHRLVAWNWLYPREWPLVHEWTPKRRFRHWKIRLLWRLCGKLADRECFVEDEWNVERQWLPRRPIVDRELQRQRRWLVKREARWWEFRLYRKLRHHPRMRAGAAVTTTISGGLAALYAFMVVVGEIDLGHSLTATVAAAALAIVWLLGAWNRSRTGAFAITRRERERRGF
jgi:hypothetical protein